MILTLTAKMSLHEQESVLNFKRDLKVKFEGEEGIDAGGVRKEFFQLIVREIFDEKYGMFKHDHDSRCYWFNSSSTDYVEFRLIGMIIGLAIFNSVILDVHFPKVVFRKLLRYPVGLEDLQSLNPQVYRSCKRLLEFVGDVEDLDLNFQVVTEEYGVKVVHDLIPNGGEIAVTNQNRQGCVARACSLMLTLP
jgi:ubiquitin-protein ligase E3 A